MDCVQEAQKALQASKKVPKIDVERMAISLMFLGYACVISNEMKEARSYYSKSVQFWRKIHAANVHYIIPLACDFINILLLTNSPSALKTLGWIVAVFDKDKESTVVDAMALARVASVAAGLKGQSLLVPLKEEETKIEINSKIIHKLYKLSIARLGVLEKMGQKLEISSKTYISRRPSPRSRGPMNKQKKLDKEKIDKELQEIKKALEEIRSEHETYKTIAKRKKQDSTTTSTTTITTTTTTTTTTTAIDSSAPAPDASAPAPDAPAPAPATVTSTITLTCSATATEGGKDGGKGTKDGEDLANLSVTKPVSTPTT